MMNFTGILNSPASQCVAVRITARISAPLAWIVQLILPVWKSSPTADGRRAVEIFVPRHGSVGTLDFRAMFSMKLKHPESVPPSNGSVRYFR